MNIQINLLRIIEYPRLNKLQPPHHLILQIYILNKASICKQILNCCTVRQFIKNVLVFHVIYFRKSSMFFQNLSKKNTITYYPEQWAKRLGQKCESCQDPIIHEKCISPCKCYYFCHKQCFRTSFEPQITNDAVDIKCGVCQQTLNIELNVQLSYDPKWNKRNIFGITVLALLIIGCICAMVMSVTIKLVVSLIFFLVYTQLIIICCLSYCLICQIRNTLYKKLITIKQVGSTKQDIQTSAFKDMDVLTAEELTKDYLFTAKK